MSGNSDVTTYDVIDGVKNNDKMMQDILATWLGHITDGIIGLANLFDPDCVVLSGSMETEIFAGDLAIVKEVNLETLKKKVHTYNKFITSGNNSRLLFKIPFTWAIATP